MLMPIGSSTATELDDLDLDAAVADSITVVEWGQGIAEGLAEDRLEIDIWTSPADFSAAGDDSERVVTIRAVGARWHGVDLGVLRGVIMAGLIMTEAPLVLALGHLDGGQCRPGQRRSGACHGDRRGPDGSRRATHAAGL